MTSLPFLDHDLKLMIPSPWVEMILALGSAICGAIVGSEREKRDKPAGLRTLVLVCLGSATFTMASYAFNTVTGDSGRVAAQIVTGIGFLGAGAIIHGTGIVTGMTTAASIWVIAAIGMVVGTGHVGAGIAAAIFTRIILASIYRWELSHDLQSEKASVLVLFEPARGKTRIFIEKLMEDHQVREAVFEAAPTPDEPHSVRITFTLPKKVRAEFLHSLASLPQVLEIARESPGR